MRRIAVSAPAVFTLTLFVSAFLLFLVQPMVGKMILPLAGGTPAVWTTCMLFFQAALLGGYTYAHWVHRFAPRRQALVHSILLAVSLVTLPIIPNPVWKTGAVSNPSLCWPIRR